MVSSDAGRGVVASLIRRIRELSFRHNTGGRWEWGYALDCGLNGCDPAHDDDGRLYRLAGEEPGDAPNVNGHRTSPCRRWVGPWEKVTR